MYEPIGTTVENPSVDENLPQVAPRKPWLRRLQDKVVGGDRWTAALVALLIITGGFLVGHLAANFDFQRSTGVSGPGGAGSCSPAGPCSSLGS